MKKVTLWLAAAALLSSFATQAQIRRTCGTTTHEQWLQQQDPNFEAKKELVEAQVQQWIQANPQQRRAKAVITIPVVVHVVYRTGPQNISDGQILSQIEVLNEDFRKMNADVVNVPAIFQDVVADVELEFCLAQRDPNGLPTDGITRTQTSVTQFTDNDAVKYTAQGGTDSWNTKDYLNIWICNLGGDILGYAQYPGQGIAASDGVVVGYKFFGRTGTLEPKYNKGRTTTHEVGHWLNLRHMWGDGFCGNDQVSDTPVQQEANYHCPTFPHPTCSNTSDMFMNYMDYTDDACMYMFTQGQKARMQGVINTTRIGLLSSNGCIPSDSAVVDNRVEGTLYLYPNPTSSMFTLTVRKEEAAPLEVTLFDQLGRQLRVIEQQSAKSHTLRLDISYLPEGIYLARVRFGDSVTMGKVVLRR